MMNRRSFLLLAGAGAAWVSLPAWIWPAAAQSDPSGFIRRVADQLTGIVNGTASETEKRKELARVIDEVVDVPEVGRFCLGRYWRGATPDQQKQYLDLFHSVLVTNITGHLGEYRGVKLEVQRSAHREDGDLVVTQLTRPDNPQAEIDWLVSSTSGGPKIIDLIAEGTSLRLTQRSDYASYLAHNNGSVDALITALRQQLAQG